jgi:hypothetical protein
MPRFAIVQHDHPYPHLDLFLEAGSVLRSWRLPISFPRCEPFAIEPIGDHRLLYLDYEGPVSNQRGTVVNVDRGTFEWIRDDSHQLILVLRGAIYSGRLVISTDRHDQWVARLDPDSQS